MRILLIAGVSALLIAGCGDRKPPEKTVFDPLLQTKQKARDVEKKLEESAQKQREQVERNELGEK